MSISVLQKLQGAQPAWVGNGLGRLLEPLANRQPAIYLALVTLGALLGYLLLLLFPLTTLILLSELPRQWQMMNQWQDGMSLGLTLLVMVLTGILSVPLWRNRFEPPHGLEINHQNAPKLVQLVEQLRQDFKYPVIDKIILREGFRVELVRTPRFGLPVLYHNTLVIGLDTLLTLPSPHFKSMLARRIGQLSGIHNRYIGWLASLGPVWAQYGRAFKQQKGILSRPLQGIFALYVRFYAGLAFYTARQNELEADRYALDIADDEEIASLFSQLIITETFLESRFWPKITQLARRQTSNLEHLPYASLTQVLRRGLNREDMQSWIKAAFNTPSDTKNITPLLSRRLENIGHHKPASPRPLKQTAADDFLDPAVKQKIIDKFDQHWLASISKKQ